MATPSQMQEAGQLEAVAEDPCPICLGTMCNAACVPMCFHRFCFGCIRRWANRTATCPLCRQPFDCVLHTVRADDDYREYAVGPSTHQQKNTARNRVRSRSPQQHDYLRQQPTDAGPAVGRRRPEGRDRAAGGDTAPGPSNTLAQQAAGEHPAGPASPFYLLIGQVLVVQPVLIVLPERRDQ